MWKQHQVTGKDYYTLAGRLIGERESGVTVFLLTDELGSVLTSLSAVGGSAAVTSNQVYSPYGSPRYRKGTVPTTKGFTGQYHDVSGLDSYHARYYDPVVGRFLSADTTQGNAQGMDPYSYVGNNPETKNDPTGNQCSHPCGGNCSPDPPVNCHGGGPRACSTGDGPPKAGRCNNNDDPCAVHSKNVLLSDRSKERTRGNAWWSIGAEMVSGIAELIAAVLDLITQQWARLALDVIAFLSHFAAGYIDYQTATGQQISPIMANIEKIAHAVAQVADYVSEIADVISVVLPGGAIKSIAERFVESLKPLDRLRNPKLFLQTIASTIDVGSDLQAYSNGVDWNQAQQNINNLAPQDAYNQCIAAHSVAICS